MIDSYLNQKVVIDLHSPFVCLGTLVKADEAFLEVTNADFHDLRDANSSRENYIASALATGIKRNRKSILVSRRDVVAISLFREVVAD